MGGFDALGSTEWKDLDMVKLIFFTSIATILDNAIMYPFWSLKTRQQVERGAHKSLSRSLGKDGVLGLYKGFPVYALCSLPAYVVYVTTYTWSKSMLGFTYSSPNSTGTIGLGAAMVPLAAGIIADVACLGFYVPVEIVVQRLQLPGRYGSTRQVLTSMWKHEGGIRAFYRGFGATVVTSGVSSGVWWMAYENVKRALTAALHQDGIPREGAGGSEAGLRLSGLETSLAAVKQSLPHMAAGFCGGALAAIASNPFDIAKTRMQTKSAKPGALSFLTGMKLLVAEEGLGKAFTRGIVPKLVTAAPLGMVSSVMYESILYLSRKDGAEAAPVAQDGNKKKKSG